MSASTCAIRGSGVAGGNGPPHISGFSAAPAGRSGTCTSASRAMPNTSLLRGDAARSYFSVSAALPQRRAFFGEGACALQRILRVHDRIGEDPLPGEHLVDRPGVRIGDELLA